MSVRFFLLTFIFFILPFSETTNGIPIGIVFPLSLKDGNYLLVMNLPHQKDCGSLSRKLRHSKCALIGGRHNGGTKITGTPLLGSKANETKV